MVSHQGPSRTMRAAYIAKYDEPYALGERPIPEIRPDEILVRVHAAGFCHSDLQVLQNKFTKPTPIGLIPSHEIAGVVVDVGKNCDDRLRLGDRVGMLNFKHACGVCAGCRASQARGNTRDPRFCEARETAGFYHDGGFAEYVAADPTTTLKLPESVGLNQAAPLMCAGATVWGSLERKTAGLREGDTVAIVGIGGLGHLGLQFAKAKGFKTVAIDDREAGRQLAAEMHSAALKPDLIVDSSDTAMASRNILEFTRDEGVAAAIVCVLGIPPSAWHFDSSPIAFRELSIMGSYVCGAESAGRMLDVVAKWNIKSQLTILPFERIPDIVRTYEDSAFQGRIVVQLLDEV
ncbi:GroES-like protein [Hortaea werneckii]|nr:GroES-like protein [Hortaea werneckii]KAI7239852.1 GroES-like protein [Hortaea werneckii]